MHNKNHDEQCELLFIVIIKMGKMGSGRALQKSLFIRNACGYKAKLVLGFFSNAFSNFKQSSDENYSRLENKLPHSRDCMRKLSQLHS